MLNQMEANYIMQKAANDANAVYQYNNHFNSKYASAAGFTHAGDHVASFIAQIAKNHAFMHALSDEHGEGLARVMHEHFTKPNLQSLQTLSKDDIAAHAREWLDNSAGKSLSSSVGTDVVNGARSLESYGPTSLSPYKDKEIIIKVPGKPKSSMSLGMMAGLGALGVGATAATAYGVNRAMQPSQQGY